MTFTYNCYVNFMYFIFGVLFLTTVWHADSSEIKEVNSKIDYIFNQLNLLERKNEKLETENFRTDKEIKGFKKKD